MLHKIWLPGELDMTTQELPLCIVPWVPNHKAFHLYCLPNACVVWNRRWFSDISDFIGLKEVSVHFVTDLTDVWSVKNKQEAYKAYMMNSKHHCFAFPHQYNSYKLVFGLVWQINLNLYFQKPQRCMDSVCEESGPINALLLWSCRFIGQLYNTSRYFIFFCLSIYIKPKRADKTVTIQQAVRGKPGCNDLWVNSKKTSL